MVIVGIFDDFVCFFFLCISIVLWWFSMFFSMFFLFFFCGCWLSKPDVSDVSAMFQGFMSFESQGFDVFWWEFVGLLDCPQ